MGQDTSEQSIADRRYMAEALKLAERGCYTTAPNPRVGCVLVRDGRIIGRGYHRRAGEGHAEVEALRNAVTDPAGATAYVTLEPCSHQGRTPPCCEALAAAGVERVVAAMVDPNPAVAGRGLAALAGHGIATESGLLAGLAAQLNRGFIRRMRAGLPFIQAKVAASLDGRTAMASGESKWITGEPARRMVQQLRAAACAIVTGVGTVVADDPSLTVRADEVAGGYPDDIDVRQPLRVIVDSSLRMPATAAILRAPGRVLVCAAADEPGRRAALEAAGATVVVLAGSSGRVDLRALAALLAQDYECNEVMVEAGPTLTGAFIEAGLVDELHLFQAPVLLGSTAQALATLPLETMAQRVALVRREQRWVGADLYLRLAPEQ